MTDMRESGPPKTPAQHRRDFLIVLGIAAVVCGALIFAINFPTAALVIGAGVGLGVILGGLWLATM